MRAAPTVLASLSVAARSATFWWAVMRHSIPVIGVTAFRWSAVSVAVMFLLESWLFLTNRLAIEVTFDRKYAGDDLPLTAGQAIYQTGKMWLLAAPVLAIMLFAFGGFVLLFAFPAGDWSVFAADDWRRTSFRVSLAWVLLDAVVDAVRFQRRLLTRSEAQRVSDDRGVRTMFYRVVALIGACVILGLAAKVGLGGPLLVLAISLILVGFEVLPQQLLGFFDDQFHGRSPDSPPAEWRPPGSRRPTARAPLRPPASVIRSAVMSLKVLFAALVLPLVLQNPNSLTPEERTRMEAQNAELRTLLQGGTKLPFVPSPIAVQRPPQDGWALGMVSWLAADRNGLVYLLQRGDKADPVIVVDRAGRIVRSWGKGMYTTPHAIRVDPQGNIWTTDAASSMVYKFSPEGKTLLQIEVGGQPAPCGNFCSTTDIAFASDGHLFIADGYRNARILEYSADGKKLREWGSAGTGPGQFRLPHSIQIDAAGVVYVADRENGRIQRFARDGKYLGEWSSYGKTFGLKIAGEAMWLSSIPRGPNGAPGWLIKVDRASGKLLGYVDAAGNHGMEVMSNGDLLQAPGPDQIPQIYRSK